MGISLGKQAVVVGAGMGGLTAAKAVSAHFERVMVLDRDALPDEPHARPGTPQARHGHVLLVGGQQALAELFPGVEAEFAGAGAVPTRLGLDIRVERPGYDPFPKRDLGLTALCMSRALIEFVTRRQLARASNVAFRARCRVKELVPAKDGSAVAGVRYEDAEGRQQTMSADLVVEASGRAQLTLAFLASIGAAKPDETEIGIDQAYSSAVFQIPDDAPTGWLGLMHLPGAPQTSRGAFLFPMEETRWIVSLGGNHGDAPPADMEGFMAFAKSLRTPTLYDAVNRARPLGDIARYVLPSSVRRHFERLERFPHGLVPIADSICRFNPVFGQGMSVAAQEACVLGRLLASRASLPQPLEGLAPDFFAAIQNGLAAPWATAETDFVFPQTRGRRPADLEGRLQYAAALTHLAAEDPSLHRMLAEVNGLVQPQSVLQEPQLVARVRERMAASASV